MLAGNFTFYQCLQSSVYLQHVHPLDPFCIEMVDVTAALENMKVWEAGMFSPKCEMNFQETLHRLVIDY